MSGQATVAVLDIGKTNVKLSACTDRGVVVEVLATPAPVLPGPPWVHPDIAALIPWVMGGLAALAGRHPLRDVIVSGHGSAGGLVGDNPDAGGTGLVLPMVDYDQPLPAGLQAEYAPLAGGYTARGSAFMAGATHTARQMFWAERAEPAAFGRAQWFLGLPQYWAWFLSGVAVSEVSVLGAQSHLWEVEAGRWSGIVEACSWGRLMPPFAGAGAVLGPVRAALCERWGVPALRVHVGGHDSSLAYHRYQAAGLAAPVVLSTGTWIVGLAGGAVGRMREDLGMTVNADMAGRPVAGVLLPGGREFAAVAGQQAEGAKVSGEVLARMVAQGSMALPAFEGHDGPFPGRARAGRLIGPPPSDATERLALAALYAALLTWGCGLALAPERDWILDGSFLRDPVFAGLVAALRPGHRVEVSGEAYGIAAGAAVLCREGKAAVPLRLRQAEALALPGLAAYAERWIGMARGPA